MAVRRCDGTTIQEVGGEWKSGRVGEWESGRGRDGEMAGSVTTWLRDLRPRGYSKKCVKVKQVNMNNFDYGKEKKGEKAPGISDF